MTFITGTITNSNPGPTLYSAIETAALALGWTLVDTVTIGSNTHKVLKSAGASGGNSQGIDWYLDINYPTTGTTGGIRFCPFETYNATSHVAGGGPYSQSNTTIDATYYSRFGATQSALETNWANTTSYTGLSTSLVTIAFTYWISITRDRIIVMLSNVATAIAYAGFFTPSSAFSSNAGSALFPLVMAYLSPPANSSNSNGASSTACLTRLPKLSAMTNSGWNNHCIIATNIAYFGNFPEGQLGVGVSPFTGRSTGTPLTVAANASGTSLTAPASSAASAATDAIGTIDDVIVDYVSSTSIRGDSITIGSDTWYGISPSNVSGLFFKGI